MANTPQVPPQRSGAQFSDPRQLRIYQRLLLVGQGPADFYFDFCAIIADPWLRSSSHVAAHLLREIESALRDVLVPAEFKKSRGSGHLAEIDAALVSMGLEQEGGLAQGWKRLAGDDPLHTRAHRDNLAQPRPLSDDARAAFSGFEEVLDGLLERLESRFLDFFGIVDSLLERDPPIARDADKLRKNVPNNKTTLAHFFARAKHPAWLPLLVERGFFEHPPEPLRDDTAGTISFPSWPQSRYLLRMATIPSFQVMVAKTAMAIPPTTNSRVNIDLADITLVLPKELATPFVSYAGQWLLTTYSSMLPIKLGELAAKLATEGALPEAVELLRVLFTPCASESPTSQQVQWVSDNWALEEVIERSVPTVVASAGVSALRRLCESLSRELALKHPVGGRDYSYIWRRAVEDHPQDHNRDHDLQDALVSAIRDGAVALAATGGDGLQPLLDLFAEFDRSIFTRLALHLLHEAAEPSEEAIRKALHNHQALTNTDLWHEYSRLFKKYWTSLSELERNDVIDWIRHGGVGPYEEEDADEQEIEPVLSQKRRRAWRWRQLARFGEQLPAELAQDFQELCREFGKVEEPEFANSGGGVWVGPTSPRSAEDLGRLPLDELFLFLRNWEPEGQFMVDTPEGLARELARAIAASPARFLSTIEKFRDLDKTYIRSLFSGVQEALKEKSLFPWPPVIDLARWVLQLPAVAGDPAAMSGSDVNWKSNRSAISHLLDDGLHSRSNPMPWELRTQVWEMIAALAEDPEPTAEYEHKYGGDNLRPYELSINTVRGVAINTAIAYGIWVDRHLRPGAENPRSDGFTETPELQELLERHLNPVTEPSLAIRSVYGRWFPWIAFLDRSWAVAKVQEIFPAAEESRRLYDAAWNSYVVYCPAYNDVLPLLLDEYGRSVDRLADKYANSLPREPNEDRLAEHLMIFYLRGYLAPEVPLLHRFFEIAPEDLRRHALAFVGRTLRDDGDLDADAIERAQALWDSRVEATAKAPKDHRKELEAFGWWFSANRLDFRWRVPRLCRALELWKRTDDPFVLRTLAEVPEQFLPLAIQCATLLMEGVSDSWTPKGRDKDLRKLLARALASPEAGPAAKELINRLAAHDHIEFRELLCQEGKNQSEGSN